MQSPRLIRKLNPQRAKPAQSKAPFRSVLTDNISLKLFALAMAVLMWGFVASQRRGESTEIRFTTPLVIKNLPANMEVTHAPVQAVGVLVTVQRSLGHSVNPNQLQVSIDLSQQLPGPRGYTLTAKNVHYNNQSLPGGMTVQFSPAVIPITLEEGIQKEVAIKPRFFGELARGFTIESIKIKPPAAILQGARTHLGPLEHIYTRPLDVQELKTNVEMLVELDLSNEVRLAANQEAFFQAFIRVTENASQLLLRDIPVIVENVRHVFKTSTSTVNVFLEGPQQVMQTLTKDNVFAVLDLSKYPPGDYRGQSPKVVVPDRVKVLEQWPIIDVFVINRLAKKTG
ncbi:MAG: hypothetical protein IIA40_00170 [SAR324 cluster bacterium]|nr:hypothetical protein [SAR324 cluster bacterium]